MPITHGEPSSKFLKILNIGSLSCKKNMKWRSWNCSVQLKEFRQWKFMFHFSIRGILPTPPHSDSHPCISPPLGGPYRLGIGSFSIVDPHILQDCPRLFQRTFLSWASICQSQMSRAHKHNFGKTLRAPLGILWSPFYIL